MDVLGIDDIWKTGGHGFVKRYKIVAIERHFERIELYPRSCFEVGRIQIVEKLEVQQLFGYLRSHRD